MQTLEIARELQQARISETSAYQMTEVINGKSGLATKEDLAELKTEVKEDIHQVRTEIHNVEKNLEGQIHAVREDIIKLEGQMIELKTAIKWLDKSNNRSFFIVIVTIILGFIFNYFFLT